MTRYYGAEQPVPGAHPTRKEAQEALEALARQSLRPEYILRYKAILEAVLSEWEPRVTESGAHYCSMHEAADGRCKRCSDAVLRRS